MLDLKKLTENYNEVQFFTVIPPLRIYHNKLILNIEKNFTLTEVHRIIINNYEKVETEYLLRRKGLNKPWYTHSLKYYLSTKKIYKDYVRTWKMLME